MCLSCGCNSPGDDHNDFRNITIQKLWDAAQAAGMANPAQAVNNIENTYALKVDPDFDDIDIRQIDDNDGDDNNDGK